MTIPYLGVYMDVGGTLFLAQYVVYMYIQFYNYIIIIIIIIKLYYRLAVTHMRRQIWQLSKLQRLQ